MPCMSILKITHLKESHKGKGSSIRQVRHWKGGLSNSENKDELSTEEVKRQEVTMLNKSSASLFCLYCSKSKIKLAQWFSIPI